MRKNMLYWEGLLFRAFPFGLPYGATLAASATVYVTLRGCIDGLMKRKEHNTTIYFHTCIPPVRAIACSIDLGTANDAVYLQEAVTGWQIVPREQIEEVLNELRVELVELTLLGRRRYPILLGGPTPDDPDKEYREWRRDEALIERLERSLELRDRMRSMSFSMSRRSGENSSSRPVKKGF